MKVKDVSVTPRGLQIIVKTNEELYGVHTIDERYMSAKWKAKARSLLDHPVVVDQLGEDHGPWYIITIQMKPRPHGAEFQYSYKRMKYH